jgi:hypothetical protein
MRHVACPLLACPLPAPATAQPAASDLTRPVITAAGTASALLPSLVPNATISTCALASHD